MYYLAQLEPQQLIGGARAEKLKPQKIK